MGTAFLILLLLALCGFIAYIGDLLGRRFGKKRLTLFGMRPKHTAIILTIATGVVIAGFTFLVALLIVPGFRQAVTQGEKLVGQNRRLRQANASQAAENGRLEHANGTLSSTNAGLQKTNTELSQTNGTLKRTNETLNQQSTELRGKNDALTHANTELAGHNSELRGTNSRLEADNSRLQGEQKKLQANADLLKQQVVSLKTIANNYRKEQYIYRRDQPIDQRVIPHGAPAQLLRTTVVNLIYSAEKTAREHGARSVAANKALYLVPPPDYPKDRASSEEMVRDWLIQQAAHAAQKPQFWRVVAQENVIGGKPVPARLEWYTNDLVFKPGDLVKAPGVGCWWPVDGSKTSEGDIVKELVFFLRANVNRAARKQQIVPDADGSVGSDQGLDWNQIIRVAHQVQEINGNAVVVARARQETRRAGPLYVNLEAYPVNDHLPEDVRQAIDEAANAGAGR